MSEDKLNENEIRLCHSSEMRLKKLLDKEDKPISSVYPVIDTDLARDNVENDIPEADLQDL